MNYKETVAYLYAALPMFQRIGAAAFKKDLTNIEALCRSLGNPENSLRFVHIAGTNGKGSVSHMLASVLQAHGFSTGLYTSPHLVSFTERIRLNGQPIPEEAVVEFVELVQPEIEKIKPSFFEITVAMAFWYFREVKAQWVVLETGMGGRLDSTNVVLPELSVITNIGWDHMQFLGNDLATIAGEKAGIIKTRVPVLVGEHLPETLPVFQQKAAECGSILYLAEDVVQCQGFPGPPGKRLIHFLDGEQPLELCLPLGAAYQDLNFRTAWAALKILGELSGGPSLSTQNCILGMEDFVANTGLRGRWERLRETPLVIADIAHNKPGWELAIDQLKVEAQQKGLHLVLGFVEDKDVAVMLAALPKYLSLHWCCPNVPRGMQVEKLNQMAESQGHFGQTHDSVAKAVRKAVNLAGENDVVYIGGSTFVVAEALPLFE